MKTRNWQQMLAIMAIAGLGLSASMVQAQDSSAPTTAQPQLSYGVSQIVKLAQAKVGDDTMIAYINNAGNSYGLNADQIIYLKQQGVSEAVIMAILNQPKQGVAVATPTTPAPQPVVSSTDITGSGSTITTASGSTATVAPTVTYVQTAPAATYIIPTLLLPGLCLVSTGVIFLRLGLGWWLAWWRWGWLAPLKNSSVMVV